MGSSNTEEVQNNNQEDHSLCSDSSSLKMIIGKYAQGEKLLGKVTDTFANLVSPFEESLITSLSP